VLSAFNVVYVVVVVAASMVARLAGEHVKEQSPDLKLPPDLGCLAP